MATSRVVKLCNIAKENGAFGVLIAPSPYNKPTQDGMYAHFKTIAEKVDLPVILYNVPGRTVADLSNDTTIRLAQVPGVIGIKDATGNLERGSFLLAELKSKKLDHFAVYSGDDLTAIFLMLIAWKI